MLVWEDTGEIPAGGIAASIELDETGWATTGAQFIDVDDDLGGKARLATGLVTTSSNALRFGVLAYPDDSISHLIVGGPREERPITTSELIESLLTANAIPDRSLVLEVVGLSESATTEDKIEYVAEIVAASQRELEEQFQLLREQVAAALKDAKAPLSTGLVERPAHAHFPFLGDIRQLRTIRGLARTENWELPIAIKAPADLLSDFSHVAPSYGLTHGPDAQLVSLDAATGEAVILFEQGWGSRRVPVIVGGLTREVAKNESIWITAGPVVEKGFQVAPQNPALWESKIVYQEPFDAFRRQRTGGLLRWIRLRLTR